MGAAAVAWLLLLVAGCAQPRYVVRTTDASAGATPARRGHGPRYKAGAIVIGTGVTFAIVGAAMTLATLQHGCSISYGDCTTEELRVNQFWAGFGISIAGDAGAAIVGPAIMISNAWQRPAEAR
jgi:hypothetical protein